MAPRRGGSGGAGAEVAGTARNYFEPPPLKRMYPWDKDGRNFTDIMAGGVDESGLFKGVYVSGVHMAALLRTFQLAKVFIPTDTPTPVAQLGQSLDDGTPLIIVTRGCFGREMDEGPGARRNQSQMAIWEAAREIRATMPQVYITCVDLPINLSSDAVQAVLEPPLNEYRELMYHDGSWYCPTVIPCPGLAVWCEDNRRAYHKNDSLGVKFQRKKFSWRNQEEFHQGKVLVTWKHILESRPKQDVVKRSDLDFTGKEKAPVGVISFSEDSHAECTFKKALAKAESAKETLAAVTGYLLRAMPSEKETLAKAAKACEDAATGDATETFNAKRLGVTATLMMGSADEAKAAAEKLISSASSPSIKAKAYRLLVECHYKTGDLDLALEKADEASKEFTKGGNPGAIAEASQMVVMAYMRKGDTSGAIEAAEKAAKSSDKLSQALGSLLVGGANKMSPGVAVTSYTKATALFKELKETRYQAGAMQACVAAMCLSTAEGDATAVAKELIALGKQSFPAKESLSKEALEKLPVTQEEGMCYQAIGHMLVVIASMSNYANSGQFLTPDAEMLSSAKAAVELFKEVGCAEGSTQAEQLLANATLATEMPGEAGKVAEKIMATSKLVGSIGRGLFEYQIDGAACAIMLGSYDSAYAAACEVGSLEEAGVWDAGAVARSIIELTGKQQAGIMLIRLGCTFALF